MVTPGLYCGLQKTSKASATFPNKVHRHGTPFLIDLGLQGHQTWMVGSLDLCLQNAPYVIVQRIQMCGIWRPSGPGPVLCQIYFIQAWVYISDNRPHIFTGLIYRMDALICTMSNILLEWFLITLILDLWVWHTNCCYITSLRLDPTYTTIHSQVSYTVENVIIDSVSCKVVWFQLAIIVQLINCTTFHKAETLTAFPTVSCLSKWQNQYL